MRVFAEARRVVVADGGGVAETLEQRRRLEDLFGDQRRRRRRSGFVDGGQVLHDQLGRFRLARTAFTADDHHLCLPASPARQSLVRRRTNREYVPKTLSSLHYYIITLLQFNSIHLTELILIRSHETTVSSLA